MSITASYRRLSPQEFRELQEDTAKANTYFGLDIDEEDEEACIAYYDRLNADGRCLDIGKSWDGLYFLLTGKSAMADEQAPPPLCNIMVGGKPTEWDATYGMVRYVTPEQVKNVAAAMEQITEAELRQRYEPAAFLAADVYPGGEVWKETDIDWLLNAFTQVRDFFARAAQGGEIVLLSSD